MKVRSRSGSVRSRSGTSTPGGAAFKSLSEGDLRKANTALKLSQEDGEDEDVGSKNGGGAVDGVDGATAA
jgi:glycogen(starch) synthase